MGMGGTNKGKAVISKTDCLRCGCCKDACENDAIDETEPYDHVVDDKGTTEREPGGYVVNDKCIGCGVCVALCGVGAINVEEEK